MNPREHVLIERPNRFTHKICTQKNLHTSSSSRRDTNKTKLKNCNIFTLGYGFVRSSETHTREQFNTAAIAQAITTTTAISLAKATMRYTKNIYIYIFEKRRKTKHTKAEHQPLARCWYGRISHSLSRFITKLSFRISTASLLCHTISHRLFSCISVLCMLLLPFFFRNICL